MPSFLRRLSGALVPLFLFAGCGGGGGGNATVTFTLTAVNPAVSDDLNGGDVVTITGTNFMTASVVNVTFGGTPGTNRVILSETQMTVQTPPAPGSAPGVVTVTVTTLKGGTKQLVGAYTYADSGPVPLNIAPTTFTPTGAESFTITGSTLGPLGGQVTVVFQGIGSVLASVSPDGTSITGAAPVTASVPLAGPITVTVNTGTATADVPTTVSYPYAPPTSIVLPIPYQAAGNASQPVRLADGFAVLCTSGLNTTWGDADDDIKIILGPPGATLIQSVQLRSPPAAPGTPVGYLSAANSIPAILGPDTFCVYTVGAGGGAGFLIVTQARTAPVADFFPHPGINAAPIAAIGPSRIAFMEWGADAKFGPQVGGNAGDDLFVQDFNLGVAPPTLSIGARVVGAGYADLTAGSANFTIPFTTDGDTVFVMGVGPDAVSRNADDTFLAHVVSTVTTSGLVPAPFLFGRPIALSPTLAAAPGAGVNLTFGNTDDTLEVFSLSGTWSRTPRALNQPLDNALALVPYARIGNGIAVVLTTPNALKIFTNVAAGTSSTLPFTGTPLLTSFGNGALVAFGPGGNLVPGGGDDQAIHIDAAATIAQSFSLVPNQLQNLVPLSDTNRAFALSPGLDAAFGTMDDTLEVYQSRSIGQARSASQLPVTRPGAPVTGIQPFVPIGPGWGLLQSPGANGVFGDGDDQLILASY